MKRTLTILGCTLVLMLACGAPAAATPTAIPSPVFQPSETALPLPTATLEPTATSTVVPSATPAGQIFRDDFAVQPGPGWRWENENSSRWSITPDGWLQIIAEDGGILAGEKQSNLLWRDLPSGEFAISVHVKTQPTTNFQQAAIFLYDDINNYVAINRGFCAPCFSGQDGNGIYMDYKINGQGDAYQLHVDQSDVYLRLVFQANVISAYYAFAPEAWQRLGRFGNYFQFRQVGLGAANLDKTNQNEDLAAQYDYFEIAKP
jgi:beta-xylosidase